MTSPPLFFEQFFFVPHVSDHRIKNLNALVENQISFISHQTRLFIVCIFNDYANALSTLASIYEYSSQFDILVVKDASSSLDNCVSDMLISFATKLNILMLVSPDNGPYDGMNTAILFGQAISPLSQCLVINSGDKLLDLSPIPREGILLCDQLNTLTDNSLVRRSPVFFKQLLLIPLFGRVFHQAFFCPAHLLQPFDYKSYPITADLVQILDIISIHGFTYVPVPCSVYLGGGLSSNKPLLVLKEKLYYYLRNGHYLYFIFAVPILLLRSARIFLVRFLA